MVTSTALAQVSPYFDTTLLFARHFSFIFPYLNTTMLSARFFLFFGSFVFTEQHHST